MATMEMHRLHTQEISGANWLTLDAIEEVARKKQPVMLSGACAADLDRGREVFERRLAEGAAVYGVNTGFGGNSYTVIEPNGLEDLQGNLLRFLCCGVGEPLSEELVRAAILLRANALARNHSGARAVVVERLLDLLNAGITPVVPRYGSVGASGDLVPSAYIARVLTGSGAVLYRNHRMDARQALQSAGIEPLVLQAKEGLALVNGTTMMTGAAALAARDARYLLWLTVGALAMVSEALGASVEYYEAPIHDWKHHPGQMAVAEALRSLLHGRDTGRTEVTPADGKRLAQAVYSLRCAPQGLGPMVENLAQIESLIEREANSSNDNPLLDPETGAIYHTGNFLGTHIGRAMDGLKLDLTNLANWTHSLVALLMDRRFSEGLPDSLSAQAGVHHGLKGMQIVHTSLVTAIRHWSGASTIHTLPTEQYNQDVVSLGTNAAFTALDIVRLLRSVVAITLIAAAQAVDLRGVSRRLGKGTAEIYHALRGKSNFVDRDRPLDVDIESVCGLIDRRGIPVVEIPV